MPEPTRIKIRLKLPLLPIAVVLLLILEVLWSERVWMMLLAAFGAVWLIDFLWMRALARGLRFHRQLRFDWAHVGDELEERFTLTNSSHVPALWVELRDHSTLPEYGVSLATGAAALSENSWRMKHVCARRGVFTLGPTSVITGTPFSVYTIEFVYAARTALVVLPAVVPLPTIQVAPGGRANEGKKRASTLERTVTVSSVRDYQEGDPFKIIHWRSVAHRGELFARTFESTPAGDWWIWLDLDANVQAGAGENSTIEHAVILAASLAARGLALGRAVGLVVNARELVWLTAQTGPAQRLEILRALATVEPGTRHLAELITRTKSALTRNASVIVITPSVDGAWLNALIELRWSGAAPTVLLLDRSTYGGSQDIEMAMALLAEWNIARYAITRAVLDQAAPPARQGEWKFTVGATGRAIARAAPEKQDWRELA